MKVFELITEDFSKDEIVKTVEYIIAENFEDVASYTNKLCISCDKMPLSLKEVLTDITDIREKE